MYIMPFLSSHEASSFDLFVNNIKCSNDSMVGLKTYLLLSFGNSIKNYLWIIYADYIGSSNTCCWLGVVSSEAISGESWFFLIIEEQMG